ncbi:DUF3298 and DUF4163 domain-containing protein [Thermomonas brevis]
MRRTRPLMSFVLVCSFALLAACRQDGPAAPAADAGDPAAAPAAEAPVSLEDVIETTPNYIVGISYPEVAAKYPELGRALHAYAEGARAELMQAVSALGGQKPTAPYDLSLQFRGLVETPRIVAVAADGSSYTGGAHGNPLVQRFVWLPQQQRMLAAESLLADPANWTQVADHVREALMTELSAQLDEDGLEAAERAQALQNGASMIDDGTRPEPANFARFEPVMNADGGIRALRFVFPPYQVAPYSEGTRMVEVPTAVLLPLVAPEFKPLFRAG